MKTIWKYEIGPLGNIFNMPKGAEILTVQMQHGKPMMWAIVDPKAPTESRSIFVVGTGHEWSSFDGHRYIGTFQMEIFVWHLFERIPNA